VAAAQKLLLGQLLLLLLAIERRRSVAPRHFAGPMGQFLWTWTLASLEASV
jgi:hypothetical protein